jgi:Cu(I)/Ag(I) efflux system membrane fusion protein
MKNVTEGHLWKRRATVVAAVLIGGILVGYWLRGEGSGEKGIQGRQDAPEETFGNASVNPSTFGTVGPSEQMVYACPMNCVSPMPRPGKCPVCGMDLMAVVAEASLHEEGIARLTLRPEDIRAAGIQVATVQRKLVTAEIRLFGRIEYDPVEQYKVTAFAPGIIDRIYVKRAGQMVRVGDPLFDMHSSELFVLEQDLFEVLKEFPDVVDYRPAKGQIYKRQMRPPRRQFSIPKAGEASEEDVAAKQAALERLSQIKRKMRLLGLTDENVERIMARGLPSGISTVITPTTGIVQQQLAFKGTYVNTGEAVFIIANPEFVWARLDGYAADFPWIRLGQEAEIRVDAFPGEVFTGKVQYVDPEFDPQSRTFRVGVIYTDTRKRLRPNMLVRCVIHSTLTSRGVAIPDRKIEDRPPLVIPETAPLITGNRAVVYVAVSGKPGTYEGRQVVLGPRASEYYVVEQGLKAGEKVVVNGNFKIDSAVQILARASMMEQKAGSVKPMHPRHDEMPVRAMEPRVEKDEVPAKAMEPKAEKDQLPATAERTKVEKEVPSPKEAPAKPVPTRRDQIKERLMNLKRDGR